MYVKNVADEFVREYYTRLYSRPSSLYQLYASNASLVHGEEGMEPYSKHGQGEALVHELLGRKGFGHSKVCVTDVSALRSAPTSIVVVVVGDMRLEDNAPRMFVQSFVLHEHPQRGPLVLTDVLKFLQEDGTASPLTPNSEVDERIKLDAPRESTKRTLEPEEKVKPTPSPGSDQPQDEAKAAETPAPALPSPSPASETSATEDHEGSHDESGDSKPRKFKFSFDTIAKAPSFRPKSAVPPAYPMPYTMGGAYSPTYSPTPAYQAALPPHLQMQQVPFQYQIPHQFVPPVHGPPVVSGRAFLELSSDQVTSEEVAATLDGMMNYKNLKIDAPRKRGYADFYTPDALMRVVSRGPIPITGSSATLTVKPARPGPRRGDSNDI